MRTLLNIAGKDLKLILRDPMGLFFIVGFPVMMGVFIGSVMGGNGKENVQLKVALVDEDDSEISVRLVQSLTEQGNVKIREMERDAAIDTVRRGELIGLIVIPHGFDESAGIFFGKLASCCSGSMGISVARNFLNTLLFRKYGTLRGAQLPEQDVVQEIRDHLWRTVS